MITNTAETSDPLRVLDDLDPRLLRERLGANLREREALKTLLRVAEKTAPARRDREEKAEASNGNA